MLFQGASYAYNAGAYVKQVVPPLTGPNHCVSWSRLELDGLLMSRSLWPVG